MTEETQIFAKLPDGMLWDYITNKPKKDNKKEHVRQRIARAIFHEDGISVEDMAADFPVKTNGKRKKVDIAIFSHGAEHIAENVRRAVICQPEPKVGRKVVKLRGHEQAGKDLELLREIMSELPKCRWGLWTNGLEFFFTEREDTAFDTRFKPIGHWPMADETQSSQAAYSKARMRRADPEMLRVAFRRCHNFIHGNEGMSKDAAFWQFLFLIFCKMYDERQPREERQFWAGPDEMFNAKGHKAIQARILKLFEQVKKRYVGSQNAFRNGDEITLSERAMAFMVGELAKYDFTHTDLEAKGAAYQEIVGNNLRGDRGQYFTPGGAVKLMVEMLNPQPDERVLDPACGTGGFLRATLACQLKRFQSEEKQRQDTDRTTEVFDDAQTRIREYARRLIFGADFDPALVRATNMNILMAAGVEGNVFHMDSLVFPQGHLPGVEPAKQAVPLGNMDVVMTNPPFGSDIPITDQEVLSNYDLALTWTRDEEGRLRPTDRRKAAVAPEVLFIQRAIDWLRPGGRMGIVLPDGILGNPGDEYIRKWIMEKCWVLASVDLPVETFIVEANVNILTSLLFLKKKTEEEINAEMVGGTPEYPVFMAVAEKVGFDRRGNTLYKRTPDGEEILQEVEEEEHIRINGDRVKRVFKRQDKIVDNDLPLIAEAYRKFKQEHKHEFPFQDELP